MPELPEVETIRRQLAPLVEGRRLERMEVLDARWLRPLAPRELVDALQGRRVERLGRRGKYLVWSFERDIHLVQHLRMTGGVLCQPPRSTQATDPPHTRVRIGLGPRAAATDGGLALAIVDQRRFGTGQLLTGLPALEAFFDRRLGLEPLDPRFTVAHLRATARGRTTSIKALLLDQRRVAGVGNIYADEALFRAGIHPLRPAGRLSLAQHARLRESLIDALMAGIASQGASIDDFRHVNGARGSFQHEFVVHRRAGKPCEHCGRPIRKILAAGRATYVCEACQPRPRRRTAGR